MCSALMIAALLTMQNLPRPAVSGEPTFQAPRVVRVELENGLQVARAQFGLTPTARVELVIRAGLSDQREGEAGVAEIVGDFLLEGTQKTSGADLAQQISGLGVLGGNISVSVGAYETVVAADVLSASLPALLHVFAELVREPAFPEAGLERIKNNRVARVAQLRNAVSIMATQRANELLFPNNPLDRVAGEAALRAIMQDKLRGFHSRNYVANRARLYIVGNYNDAEVNAAIRGSFGSWSRGEPALPLPVASISSNAASDSLPVIHLVHRTGGTQARIHVAVPIVDQAHADHLVLNELNVLMGSVQTSRIIANVRERHGYSYNVSSRLARRPGSSQWVITADVARDVTGAALREILAELTRLHTEPPAPEEIGRYQRFMAGVLIYENSSARGVIESLRWIDLYGADPTYFTDFVRHVNAVRPGDFQRVIRQYLPLSRFAIVVVGDRDAIREQLLKVGRVVE